MNNENYANIIFTHSGIRGIVDKSFTKKFIEDIGFAFRKWLNKSHVDIIIGRDTRPSSNYIQEHVIKGLGVYETTILNANICPTPVLIHAKRQLNLPAGIIITGSHNSPQWNGLKLLNSENYLNGKQINEIRTILESIHEKRAFEQDYKPKVIIKEINPLPNYIEKLITNLNIDPINKQNDLRIVVDPGAGAAKDVTPRILQKIGCDVKVINDDLLVGKNFPRKIEPIRENLKDLIMEVWQNKYDLGFAHDSDGDRLAIVNEKGEVYPEDVGLALIMKHFLETIGKEKEEIYFVTNIASSLMFDIIAKKYNVQIIRTPIGEYYLTDKIRRLMIEKQKNNVDCLIFGGEGSCGGIIFPYFNNTRDGIFAAAKIVEIVLETGQKISTLASRLPRYYSYREIVELNSKKIKDIITNLKLELMEEGENVTQIENDLKFGDGKEWFVLIHPSNTEPLIRVISEAKSESLARIYCETTAELVRMIINESI